MRLPAHILVEYNKMDVQINLKGRNYASSGKKRTKTRHCLSATVGGALDIKA